MILTIVRAKYRKIRIKRTKKIKMKIKCKNWVLVNFLKILMRKRLQKWKLKNNKSNILEKAYLKY
jgi:hypothetical protein